VGTHRLALTLAREPEKKQLPQGSPKLRHLEANTRPGALVGGVVGRYIPMVEVEGAGTAQVEGRHLCCTMSAVILMLVRGEGGDAAVRELLAEAASQRSEEFLTNAENWISLNEAMDLLAAGAKVTRDPGFARRVGESTLRQHSGTPASTLLRSLGSPEAILHGVAMSAAKVSTVTDMTAIDSGPGHATVRAVAREGFTRRSLHCDWASGLISCVTVLFGLPPARVVETECQARGGSQCLYEVSWDADRAAAAADPEQRVTALEAQLMGMSDRLQSAYATACDLISTTDLETALRRIVARAANAVRAPGFVLAVRPSEGTELEVYWHGMDEAEAREVARRGLASADAQRDSMLTVKVSSSRRDYGVLIARYPTGMEFFPQEQEQLQLYAEHAAAVLDMTTALEQSARRHAQVSALLSLAQALARAGTTVEISDRLIEAVPDVVDCDRVAVALWDEDAGQLTSASVYGYTPDQRQFMDSVVIRPAEAPCLAQLLSDPQPLFVDPSTEDPLLSRLIAELEACAFVVVPIVAREAFLGTLTVAVTERAERLRAAPELLERLTGIAALAAPAIQSGLLVDQLRHRAHHDGLTGAVNRSGFGHRMQRLLGDAEGGHKVGLLFVDLDHFKLVNDAHGHDVGDELLRVTASRLAGTVRGGDFVARMGGDEFTIILADAQTREQLAATEVRVRAVFDQPFALDGASMSVSASVGCALWPEDAADVEALLQTADAAMYRDKFDRAIPRHRSTDSGSYTVG
jgi:diguanylate cyclase (GGDEF)-like protein